MKTPGLIVAPLTPFTAGLKLDERALQRQIDYVVKDCRATLVVAAGVETQEYTYLSLAERKALIRRTIELVDGRVPVMVGISHASFKTAIELAHDAERFGAAAVQLLAPLRPFAGPPTQADLIAYFEATGRAPPQPRSRRRRVDPRHHRARQAAAGAAHQGKLARSCPRVAADRRDR